MKARRRVAVAAALAGAATLASLFPFIPGAYQSPDLHVFFQTSDGLIALVAAYLLFGRVRQHGHLNDLVLVYGLVVLGATNLLVSLLPAARVPTGPTFLVWAPLVGRLVGAIVFAISSLLPPKRLARPERTGGPVAVAALATLSVITLLVATLAGSLPRGLAPETFMGGGVDWFSGPPLLHLIFLASMSAYALAAFGFLRRYESDNDEFMGWLAAAATLAAIARFNYFLFPSLVTDWVYVGDVIRYAANVVILYGAAHEIRSYWRSTAEAAVADERRRMARELHDGLAQELTFIWREARGLRARDENDPLPEMIASSAERALDESRQAIAALTRPQDESLDISIAKAAEQVAARAGIHLTLDLEPGVELRAEAREALLRIVREAVSNAARHAHADVVAIELHSEGDLTVCVKDNGVGFDPSKQNGSSGGFGLISMKERAEALGGRLNIESEPGAGTKVEVVLQ